MKRKSHHATHDLSMPPFSVRHKLPMFSVGDVVATPGALGLLDRYGLNAATILRRQMWGDFGTACAEDRVANLAAIGNGARILSAYEVSPDGAPTELIYATSSSTVAAFRPRRQWSPNIWRPWLEPWRLRRSSTG